MVSFETVFSVMGHEGNKKVDVAVIPMKVCVIFMCVVLEGETLCVRNLYL